MIKSAEQSAAPGTRNETLDALSADNSSRRKVIALWLIALMGPAAALWTWASPLSFIPVPWPDDSAFYFVAKDFFHWPPRWVMLPQAPFEPSYRIWNFNTMPLYPILIGLGRWVEIDGSHALKFWPLSFWALSSSFFGVALYKNRLPAILAALVAFTIAMDPELRWASVLVRPESLIGLAGIVLVTGLSLGWFTKKDYEHSIWDPIAALLAIGAYAHFNAVHLLFAVVPILIFRPRRLVDVAIKTTMYLLPWLFTVALKPQLFFQQMTLQWQRLAVGNGWLDSASSAIHSIFQQLGSPEEWPSILNVAAVGIWLLIFLAMSVLAYTLYRLLQQATTQGKAIIPIWLKKPFDTEASYEVTLVPPAGWILGSMWLWHNKPEVWFVYYIHLAVWTFAGLALLKIWRAWKNSIQTQTKTELQTETQTQTQTRSRPLIPVFAQLTSLTALIGASAYIFLYASTAQSQKLGKSPSWHWSTYNEFIDCIDRQLTPLAAQTPNHAPLKVWAPTFPDITIELSRRHPDWEFSRTNDFFSRSNLALRHGFETDVMVVPETLNWEERNIDAPWNQHPEVHSVWMDWQGYYLHQFMQAPGWKPNRYLCQKGRWQAFIFKR